MALTHVADTSVLTRLRHTAIYQKLVALFEEGEVARATISDLELGFTARNDREWDKIQKDLRSFAPLETTAAHVHRALNVQRTLAGRGLQGRKIPDLLVAAAAEEAGLVLLHYDGDFDLIARITRQPCEWIVPRGSVD